MSSSPSPGRGAFIAVPNPNTVLTGTYGAQVYKTPPGYAPSSPTTLFTRSSNGLPAQGVNNIARDGAAVNAAIYAALDGGGVFKSTDLGATWVDSNGTGGGALSCRYIGDIDTPATDAMRLYAVSNCGAPTGVFRSTDGGTTWSAALTGAGPGQMPAGTSINQIISDPTNADIVYASAVSTGVWKSTDGGLTWAQINSGLSAGALGANLRATRVRLDYTNPSKLYVAIRGGGFFHSANGGATWTPQNTGLPGGEVTNLNVYRPDPNIVFAVIPSDGVYKGVNSGGTITWSLLTAALPGPSFISSPLGDPATLYVGAFEGFYRSTDAGTTWVKLTDGLPPSDTNAVAVDPTNAAVVYATTTHAFYRSANGGIDWTRTAIPGVSLRSGLEAQIAIDAATPSTLYVATFSNGIYKSTNSGASFSAVNSGLPASLLAADATVVTAPSSPATLYAGFFDGTGISAGLYKSVNGGANWSNLTANLPNASARRIRSLYVNPANANIVWALTGDGPYRTIDGGASWALGGPGTNFGSGRGMAFDPGDANAIWLGRFVSDALGNANATTSGVFKSSDAGVSYQRKVGGVSAQRVALTRNGANTTVYAAVWPDPDVVLGRSDDGGTTWYDDSAGLTSGVVRSFATSPSQSSLRFAAGNGIGVARKSYLAYGPDYDRTGRADVFWRNAIDGNNVQWFMDGANLAGFAFLQNVPVGAGWSIAGQADFDGDGKTDILWRNSTTGQNLIWFMDGSVLTSAQSPPAVPVGVGWTVAGLGDFDCDGKSDIFWRNTSNGSNVIWLMNGAVQSAAVFQPTVPTSYSVVGVGDLDGDCKSDVMWRDATSGTNASWLMNGTTISTLTFYVTVPSAWTVVGVGDFNGDGKSDLLWRNGSDGSNLIWFMNGTTLASSASLPALAIGSGWSPVSVADFDGDGLADIFWYNTSSGLATIWFMNAGTVRSSAFQPSVPPATGWQVQKQ